MPFLRPHKMAKIGLIGLKDDREALLTTLHDLNVLQIEAISKELPRTDRSRNGGATSSGTSPTS